MNNKINNGYWDKICDIERKQTAKGIKKYGQVLEDNVTLTPEQRITYFEEELVDALKYAEHIKTYLNSLVNTTTSISANTYQTQALRTLSEPAEQNVMKTLINGALGLTGECGEVADHIKKHFFQNHPLDREHLINELGDVSWYLAITAAALGVNLSEVFEKNIEKLQKRYPNGFEKERSLHRNV